VEYTPTQNAQDEAPAVALDGGEIEVLTRLLSKVITTASPRASRTPERMAMVNRAEQHYAFRRLRERIAGAAFGEGLFADPSWDMMLDLYIQTSRGISVSVSSACIGATAPPTTALRYLADLEKRGIIRRFSHPTDKRSLHVQMTEEGMDLMDRICAQMPEYQSDPALSLAIQKAA